MTQKESRKAYKKRVKRMTIDFYPTEKDMWDHLQAQPQKQTYIKNLIREDMEGSWSKIRICPTCKRGWQNRESICPQCGTNLTEESPTIAP